MSKFLCLLAAVAAFDLQAFEIERHTNVVRRGGVTLSQKGGLADEDYVVRDIEPGAFDGKVTSVNGETGAVEVTVQKLGAVPSARTINGKGLGANISLDAGDVGALPDSEDDLVTNANFQAAVERVSPPVVLPEKWALGNVTNESGGAVSSVDVGAVAMNSFARDFSTTADYEADDAVVLNGRFFVFDSPFKARWHEIPEDYGHFVDSGAEILSVILAQKFVPLGFSGTNGYDHVAIDTGYDPYSRSRGKIRLLPNGVIIERGEDDSVLIFAETMEVRHNGQSKSVDLWEVLSRADVLPVIRGQEGDPAYEKYPISGYYMYQYLTNKYTETFWLDERFLKKADASSTYLSKTDASATYAAKSGIRTEIDDAIANAQVRYLYNREGTMRVDNGGSLERQVRRTGYIDWTNRTSGTVLHYSTSTRWTGTYPGLGDFTIEFADGVYRCVESPMIRYTENYPGETVITLSPLGTFYAFNPPYMDNISWEVFDSFARESSIEPPGDYRDPTDNICHKTEFGEWTFSDGGQHALTWDPNEEIWFDELYSPGKVDGDHICHDFNATFLLFDGGGEEFTATRSAVCTTNEFYTTVSFVTNAVSAAKYVPNATDPTFSNAVLAVQIDTNTVAQIGELKQFFDDPPTGAVGASLGGIILALLGAAAYLKKKTALLETDGTATNEFATDLLGKQVAISAVQDIVNDMFDNGDTTAYPRTTGEG